LSVDEVRHYGDMEEWLSARDSSILDFEAKHARDDGNKEASIRAALGIPKARYYQLLNQIIDKPEALKAEPMLVKRLLNRRDSRARARASRTQQ
jgi:hypothetical protein